MAVSVYFPTGLITSPTRYLASRYLPFPNHIVDKKGETKSRTSDPNAKLQRHAAQIYAEMLAQVCHKDQYERNLSGSQEVPTL